MLILDKKIGELIKSSFIEKFQSGGFRVSGDEFVLLFRQSYLDEFKKTTALFENCTISFFDSNKEEEKTFSVKVSFGIALNDADCDFQILRNRAELACKKLKLCPTEDILNGRQKSNDIKPKVFA